MRIPFWEEDSYEQTTSKGKNNTTRSISLSSDSSSANSMTSSLTTTIYDTLISYWTLLLVYFFSSSSKIVTWKNRIENANVKMENTTTAEMTKIANVQTASSTTENGRKKMKTTDDNVTTSIDWNTTENTGESSRSTDLMRSVAKTAELADVVETGRNRTDENASTFIPSVGGSDNSTTTGIINNSDIANNAKSATTANTAGADMTAKKSPSCNNRILFATSSATSSSFSCCFLTKYFFYLKSTILVKLLKWYEQYKLATAAKLYDVEELIDYYFHRRIAAIFAVWISDLPWIITPNQITIFGLLLGLLASLCLYHIAYPITFITKLIFYNLDMKDMINVKYDSNGYPVAYNESQLLLYSSLLLLFWIVSDCADGQVARLCKRGTRTGRILDGIVDGLVITPNMFALGFLTSFKYQEGMLWFTTIAGMSLWLHALVYDKIKNCYMIHTMEQSEVNGESTLSVYDEFQECIHKNGWFCLDSFLFFIYYHYLMIQEKLVGQHETEKPKSSQIEKAVTATIKNGKNHHITISIDLLREIYRQKYYSTIRLCSYLGISTHVTGLYIALLFAQRWWYSIILVQYYYMIFLNIILVIVVYQYYTTGMCSYTQIEKEINCRNPRIMKIIQNLQNDEIEGTKKNQ